MIKSANIVSDFADSVLAEATKSLAYDASNMRAETNVQLAFAESTVQLAAQRCSVVKMWSVSYCPGRGRRSILMSKKREKATT